MTEPQAMTTPALQAKVQLRRAWFEAHPNQPMPEGRAEVERLFAAIEAEAATPPALDDGPNSGAFRVEQAHAFGYREGYRAASLPDRETLAQLIVTGIMGEPNGAGLSMNAARRIVDRALAVALSTGDET